MKRLPTKISKSGTTYQSSTVSGQREMLRELRNKVNELIDYLDDGPDLPISHDDGWDTELGRAVLTGDHPLYGFVKYRQEHPDQRFWQALKNWTGRGYVYLSEVPIDDPLLKDTFYIQDSFYRGDD